MRRPISVVFIVLIASCGGRQDSSPTPLGLVFPEKPPIVEGDPQEACIPPGPKPEPIDFGIRRGTEVSYYTQSEFGYREMWKYMAEVWAWMDAAEACLKQRDDM